MVQLQLKRLGILIALVLTTCISYGQGPPRLRFTQLPQADSIGSILITDSDRNLQFTNNLRYLNSVFSVTGDINFDSGTLFVDATNNRVGIGTNSPSYLLDLYKVDTMSAVVDRALRVQDILTYSGTGAKYQQGISASAGHFVPTGLTNTGYLRGISLDVTTGYGPAGNSGSLGEITGMQINAGIESLNSNAPTVTDVIGLNIWPFYQAGSVTNLYGLKLQNANTGGSVTNYYGIYQEDANAKNYFNGNVGIGTISPQNKLHVGSANGAGAWMSAVFTDGLGVSLTGTKKSVYMYTSPSIVGLNAFDYDSLTYIPLSIGWGSNNVYIAQDGGNVGIGTTSPSYTLHVNGSVAGVGAYVNLSDIDYKKNIYDLTDGLDKILQLRPVTFNWKNEDYGDRINTGFIAQEVELILPDVVLNAQDGVKSLATTDLIPVLTKAIQEQQAIIETQNTKITELETALQALITRVEQLENQ